MNNTENMNALREFSLPSYEEIPDVGLYLDQTAKYINGYFRSFPQMTVTTSMISNYVKLKLVARVHKKTYNRDQIACFIMIVLAKTVLSMDHIRIMLGSQSVLDHSADYALFIQAVKRNLTAFTVADGCVPGHGHGAHPEMLNTVASAIAHKMYLEWYFESAALPE